MKQNAFHYMHNITLKLLNTHRKKKRLEKDAPSVNSVYV